MKGFRPRDVHFTLPFTWVVVLGVLLVALTVAAIAGATQYFHAMQRLQDYTALVAEVDALRQQNLVVQELEAELRELRDLQQQMLKLAGIKPVLGVDMDDLQEAAAVAADTLLEGGTWNYELLYWPVQGEVAREFSAKHPGMDIAVSSHRAILASGTGIVTRSDRHRSQGQRIIVQHGDSLETVYANNALNLVEAGETVEAGQVIGLVGEGPEGKDAHVHFQVISGGKPVDPQEWIPEVFAQ